MNCPIIEQTADGTPCGRCWFHLTAGPDGYTCPRHGDVSEEVIKHDAYFGRLTLENVMRKRKGLPLLGRTDNKLMRG